MSKVYHCLTAVIYDKRGRVLSVGKNSYTKTHPLMYHIGTKVGLPEKVFLHAEVDAIIKCPDLTQAHTIKVFRTSKQGAYLNAKPCPICQEAIRQTPIKHILHT